jgi:hypothetical protein
VLSRDLQVSIQDDDWEDVFCGDEGDTGDDGEGRSFEEAHVETGEDTGLQENFLCCGVWGSGTLNGACSFAGSNPRYFRFCLAASSSRHLKAKCLDSILDRTKSSFA